MAGLAFPFTDAAVQAIQVTFKNEKTDYVQLSIDMNKEMVNLKSQSTCTIHELPERVPEDAPKYHLFRFSHTHEGDFLKSIGKYKGVLTTDNSFVKYHMKLPTIKFHFVIF